MGDELPSAIDTVVVGAGQAGLIMSCHLGRAGREHVVLDRRETLGGGWQDRWDAFQLVSPSWTTGLPGYPYDGPAPDGYLHRDEVVARIAGYAAAIEAPVRLGTNVERLTADDVGASAVPPRDRVAARSGRATSSWRPAPSTRRGSRRPPRHSRRGSTSSTPTTTATPIGSRQAACCWSGPARRASSWPRSCSRPGAT